jgi:hypothetical protein
MTTIETAAFPAPVQSRKDRSVPVTFGAILATVGTVVALGGGGILALAGTDGMIESGSHRLATPTAALESDVAKIDSTRYVTKVLGTTRAQVSVTASAGGPAVFVGVGRAADVDRYLANAPTDRVTDFAGDPWTLDTARQAGDAKPKPPATQSFWVAKSSGRAPSVDWKVSDGSYRLVVMNADGSRGVSTDATFAVTVPHLSGIAIAALILGLVMVCGGIALIAPSIGGPSRIAPTTTTPPSA